MSQSGKKWWYRKVKKNTSPATYDWQDKPIMARLLHITPSSIRLQPLPPFKEIPWGLCINNESWTALTLPFQYIFFPLFLSLLIFFLPVPFSFHLTPSNNRFLPFITFPFSFSLFLSSHQLPPVPASSPPQLSPSECHSLPAVVHSPQPAAWHISTGRHSAPQIQLPGGIFHLPQHPFLLLQLLLPLPQYQLCLSVAQLNFPCQLERVNKPHYLLMRIVKKQVLKKERGVPKTNYSNN